jgi:hypothetical protein
MGGVLSEIRSKHLQDTNSTWVNFLDIKEEDEQFRRYRNEEKLVYSVAQYCYIVN